MSIKEVSHGPKSLDTQDQRSFEEYAKKLTENTSIENPDFSDKMLKNRSETSNIHFENVKKFFVDYYPTYKQVQKDGVNFINEIRGLQLRSVRLSTSALQQEDESFCSKYYVYATSVREINEYVLEFLDDVHKLLPCKREATEKQTKDFAPELHRQIILLDQTRKARHEVANKWAKEAENLLILINKDFDQSTTEMQQFRQSAFPTSMFNYLLNSMPDIPRPAKKELSESSSASTSSRSPSSSSGTKEDVSGIASTKTTTSTTSTSSNRTKEEVYSTTSTKPTISTTSTSSSGTKEIESGKSGKASIKKTTSTTSALSSRAKENEPGSTSTKSTTSTTPIPSSGTKANISHPISMKQTPVTTSISSSKTKAEASGTASQPIVSISSRTTEKVSEAITQESSGHKGNQPLPQSKKARKKHPNRIGGWLSV